MVLNRLNLATALWLLICTCLTILYAYSDYKAIESSKKLDELRELSKTTAVIEQSVNSLFTLVNALEAFVRSNEDIYSKDGGHDEFHKRFQRFASSLEKDQPSILSLQLAPGGVVTFVSRLSENSKAVGHDLLKDDQRRDQVIRTIIDKATVVAGPLSLIQGGNAFIARKAIFTDAEAFDPNQLYITERADIDADWPKRIPKDFWGFATMLIDSETLFKEFGMDSLPSQYEFAIRGRHGLGERGEIFWGSEAVFEEPNYTRRISLPGGSWIIGIKRTTAIPPTRTLIIVLVGSALFAIGAYSIRTRQKRLEAEAEAKTHSRFLATMSHEIRTPMNGIIGVAEVLQHTELSAKQRDYLEKILSSSKLLLRLVNDVLDFSKMDSGKLALEHKPYNPEKVLRSAIHAVELEAEKKMISLDLEIASSLPTTIQGDDVRLQQVLVNLLSNAVKFTEKGSIRVLATEIELEGRKLLNFRIEDTGIGISEQDLKKIFNPFTQADQSITRKFGGTGLGLVICEKLVKLMGGNISVDSKQGVGSVFQVFIPYDEHENDDAGINLPQNVTASTTLSAKPKHGASANIDHNDTSTNQTLRLLVVDDQPINIEVAEIILQQLGYESERAQSAKEAIELIKHNTFDIVFMDRHMPEMDGLEATRVIRKHTGSDDFPWIIALTASAQESEKEEYMAAGANDFMSKPVDIESFTRALQRFRDQQKR